MMRASTMVWLIQRGMAERPVAEFLHDYAAAGYGWSTDRGRARRFKTRAEAERTADDLLAGQAHASAHSLSDLVRAAARGVAHEIDDLVGL